MAKPATEPKLKITRDGVYLMFNDGFPVSRDFVVFTNVNNNAINVTISGAPTYLNVPIENIADSAGNKVGSDMDEVISYVKATLYQIHA